MYTSIVTIYESVIIFMYVCIETVQFTPIRYIFFSVLFEITTRMSQSVRNFKFKEC